MRFETDFVVNCKNPACLLHGPIFLPQPSQPQTSASLKNWPKDDWQAYLLCHQCGFVYKYSKPDVISGMSQEMGLWQSNRFLRIQLKCDRKDCLAPVVVFAFWPVPVAPEDIKERIHFAEGARCQNGYAFDRSGEITSLESVSLESL